MIKKKSKITNKEADEGKETEGETIGISKRDIDNLRQSSRMDTVVHLDGKQSKKAPNVSDVSKAMSQS